MDTAGGEYDDDMTAEEPQQQLQDIQFLTLEQVLILHAEGIKRYSPTESLTILNQSYLESAVATPQQTFGGVYLYQSLTEMAVAYLVGLACNHAFENGNKRVAFAACSTFLRMNGYQLTLTQAEATGLTMGIVTRKLTRADAVQIVNGAISPL
jgi:death-on-curing protein